MPELAPIVLFAYNRPAHTIQTLEALSNNDLAKESTLYIFCDGPKEDADAHALQKINETRQLVKSKQWCKEVIVREKEKNQGLAGSVIAGVTEILNKHGKIIVLEDDIVTGKGFLAYMNEALNLYRDDENVISIHAYIYPIRKEGLGETFFLKGADCWGWATWSRGWALFKNDAEGLYRQITERNLQHEFDFNGAYPYTQMLKQQIEKKVSSWAILWYASAFLKDKYTLYPSVSLVKNIGLDGSGTHGKNDSALSSYFTDYCKVERIPVKQNNTALNRIRKVHMPPKQKMYKRILGFTRRRISRFMPPVFIDMLRSFRKKETTNLLWAGPFENWESALSNTKGYDDQLILQKVRTSLLKVKNGEAVYERDSVLFDKIQYAWPLLACLENIALANNNKLHVIDFGGSLGSTYFQNRHFFKNLSSFKWIVVEQKHFNVCGKQEFEDGVLQFEDSIDDALKTTDIHCLVLSSVLPYLSNPFEWVDRFCNYKFDYILIDRTGFIENDNRVLTVQTVPPEIYDASYPCWFFNEEELIKLFLTRYNLKADFNDSFTPDINLNGKRCYWKGFYLQRK